MTPRRDGVTLVELLVVLAIIGILLGLLLPAVQAARERARETVCKNNLHQVNLAMGQFAQVHQRIPGPGSPGIVGGWMIDILPFIEQKNLHDHITLGEPIADAPKILLRQPRIFHCPVRSTHDEPSNNAMDVAHYVLVRSGRSRSYSVFDAPIDLESPWASGPEMKRDDIIGMTGPHHRGFHYASSSQGVALMMDGRRVR